MRGKLDHLVIERGWGFIRGEDNRQYFLYQAELTGLDFGDLVRGDQIEFTPAESGRGPRATKARLAPEPVAGDAA